MIVLDASVLIAAMTPDDSHHVAAISLLATLDEGSVSLIHSVNLAEVLVGQVPYGLEESAALEIAASGVAAIGTDVDTPVRLARLRASTKLGLPDCCALDAALETGYAIATFDDRLARAAKSLGIPLAA
jgi:predicted nucleic acid-binding protein